MGDKCVFVTVGTTEFDALIRAVCSSEVLSLLHSSGYRQVVLQTGSGAFEPPTGDVDGVHVQWFRLKPSIDQEMRGADLVISHAGAGSVLEALHAHKSLLVVVNDSLMDNHQTELAHKMQKEQFCFCTTVPQLADVIRDLNPETLRPFPPSEPDRFGAYVDALMAS